MSDNNPHDLSASPLHDEKVTVWCGITSRFILGTYFLEEVTDGTLQTCTVTCARYLDMLTHYAILELQRLNALSEVLWMRDGSLPHVGSSVKCLLSHKFIDTVISHHVRGY